MRRTKCLLVALVVAGSSCSPYAQASPTIIPAPPSQQGGDNLESLAFVPLEEFRGTFLVPVTINEQLTLRFVIDSGASDVVIPSDVISTLRRTGTIEASDFLGSGDYILADGSRVSYDRYRIRTLRINNVLLENVAAITSPQSGSLLLGQSFLSRFDYWSIDNSRHLLLLKPNANDGGAPGQAASSLKERRPSSSGIGAYEDTYFIAGALLRASHACSGESQSMAEVSSDLISNPEIKSIENWFPQLTKSWMDAGATDFNNRAAKKGVVTTCEDMVSIRAQAEIIIAQQKIITQYKGR